MNQKIIIHVSESKVSPNSGMGRVTWYWKHEFEKRGFSFVHIGPEEVGPIRHPGLFPYKAWNYFKKLNINPELFIVHEPASGLFVNKGVPCFLESHGVEQRYWNAQKKNEIPGELPSFKTSLLFPLWRLRLCNKGLRKANYLLLINKEDKDFVCNEFGRKQEEVFLFKNGFVPHNITSLIERASDEVTVLFNASWIPRKGGGILVEAAKILLNKGYRKFRYLLIGTGKEAKEVKEDWPLELQNSIEIIPKFTKEEENSLLNKLDLFVLPSYFEGQPLSLIQAMAAGKCCISTNCCGQKDIIINGENGFLFPKGDATKLASLMERCILEPKLRERIGQNAKESMRGRSWENVSSEVVDFILSKV